MGRGQPGWGEPLEGDETQRLQEPRKTAQEKPSAQIPRPRRDQGSRNLRFVWEGRPPEGEPEGFRAGDEDPGAFVPLSHDPGGCREQDGSQVGASLLIRPHLRTLRPVLRGGRGAENPLGLRRRAGSGPAGSRRCCSGLAPESAVTLLYKLLEMF